MATIRQPFSGAPNKKTTESHWRSTTLAKGKSCFSIVSLLKDTTIQLRKLNADGPQEPLRQRPKFAVALKQCLNMQDAHLAETRQSLRPIRPEHQQRQREDQLFEGGEIFDYYVDRKTGWRSVEGHGETRRQHLHLQHRRGKTHNGRRVGAHGILHHLINGGFGFLERIPENRRGAWTGHPLTTHIVQYSLITARTEQSLRTAHLCV